MAVTKKFSADVIREGYQLGMRDFGENYVQEFATKYSAVGDLSEARFHMIGHLQSNKAAVAVDLFQVIQTADTAKLLQRLDRAAIEANRKMRVLLEIKLSEEATKTGASPEMIPELLETAAALRSVSVTGLMTVPPWSENAEESRPYFRKLFELAARYSLPELSMGMSNDLEAAIEEGATIVRVGTALFGARPKPVDKG